MKAYRSICAAGRRRLSRITLPLLLGLALALLAGLMAVTASAQQISGPLYIRDDATGGDCAQAGIWEYSSKTCTLSADLIFSDTNGIEIASNSVTLDGNGHSLTGNGANRGVYLNGKNGITIRNLTVKQFAYGIKLDSSAGNTLSGNATDSNNYGIELFYSTGNNLSGNTMAGNQYNFSVLGDADGDLDNNVDTTNLVNGKPVYYIKNATNQTFDASTNAGTFLCVNCSNVTIKDLTLSNNGTGLFLYKAQNSHIENVNASNNSYGIWIGSSTGNTLVGNTTDSNLWHGIYLRWHNSGNTINGNTASSNSWGGGICVDWSNGNTLSNNIVSSNKFGVGIGSSSNNNIITGNTSSSNREGISIFSSTGNSIYRNNFVGNSKQAYVYGSAQFNLPAPEGGNYWSDYDTPGEGCNDSDADGFCDSPYLIKEVDSRGIVTVKGQDNLPLTQPAPSICSSALPLISLTKTKVYWASYADYQVRILSINYSVANGGSDGADDVKVVGSTATNNVASSTPMPVSLGTMKGGSSSPVTLKYSVPAGVTSFKVTTYLTAKDSCGTIYSYPGPYPGS